MFPDLPRERFQQVGNTAGTGARQMLVSAQPRALAQDFVRRDRYIELTNYPNFTRRYGTNPYRFGLKAGLYFKQMEL